MSRPNHVHGGPGFKRCPHPICRAVRAAKRDADRAKKRAERYFDPDTKAWIHPQAPHGTNTGYTDWTCRCLIVPGTEDTPGCTPVGKAEAKRLRSMSKPSKTSKARQPPHRDNTATPPRGHPIMSSPTLVTGLVILFVLVNVLGYLYSGGTLHVGGRTFAGLTRRSTSSQVVAAAGDPEGSEPSIALGLDTEPALAVDLVDADDAEVIALPAAPAPQRGVEDHLGDVTAPIPLTPRITEAGWFTTAPELVQATGRHRVGVTAVTVEELVARVGASA